MSASASAMMSKIFSRRSRNKRVAPEDTITPIVSASLSPEPGFADIDEDGVPIILPYDDITNDTLQINHGKELDKLYTSAAVRKKKTDLTTRKSALEKNIQRIINNINDETDESRKKKLRAVKKTLETNLSILQAAIDHLKTRRIDLFAHEKRSRKTSQVAPSGGRRSRRTRKHKKSRTRRRHKKSRKY
jgi:hypothetical protein